MTNPQHFWNSVAFTTTRTPEENAGSEGVFSTEARQAHGDQSPLFPSAKPRAELSKVLAGRRLDAKQRDQLIPIAVTLGVTILLGLAFTMDRGGKPTATSLRARADVVPLEPVATFSADPTMPLTMPTLPEFDGEPTPVILDDMEMEIIEAKLRERLRREGKLP